MTDPYVYPDTHVLINRLDIRDPDELERLERLMSAAAAIRRPDTTDFSPKGYCDLHKHLFGDLYPWAGELRSVNLSKDNTRFCQAPYIAPSLQQQFATLKNENYLQGLNAATFAEKAAIHAVELNSIHPFREGNGRTLRAYLEDLAKQAGHNLQTRHFDRNQWMKASILGHNQALWKPMAEVLSSGLNQPDRTRSRRRGRSRSR